MPEHKPETFTSASGVDIHISLLLWLSWARQLTAVAPTDTGSLCDTDDMLGATIKETLCSDSF